MILLSIIYGMSNTFNMFYSLIRYKIKLHNIVESD